MDKLMNAANASFEPTIKGVDSKINTIRFKRIIAQVYISTCEMFKGLSADEIGKKIHELMQDNNFIRSISMKGVTHDVITIKEALEWTAKYVTTGEKDKFYLVAAFDADTVNKEPESRVNDIQLWTAAILTTTDCGMSYDVNVLGKNAHFEVVNKSMSSFEMSFKED